VAQTQAFGTNNGQTLLRATLQLGNLKFSLHLMEHSFDVNSHDNQGRTPLHVMTKESKDVALLLLECGTDPGIQDDAGQTPLHAAS
jgi:ankyrin repeat protein